MQHLFAAKEADHPQNTCGCLSVSATGEHSDTNPGCLTSCERAAEETKNNIGVLKLAPFGAAVLSGNLRVQILRSVR